MTDPFVRDDVLEAVLRSRAGDGVPPDLHGSILAAVAADGPRVEPPRRCTGRPWRLLAVAAVLLGTIGTAVFVGGSTPVGGDADAGAITACGRAHAIADALPDHTNYAGLATTATSSSDCGQVPAFVAATHAVIGSAWGSSTPSSVGVKVAAGSIAAWADHGDGTSDVVLVDPSTGARTTLISLGIARNKYADLQWAPDGSALGIGFGSDECTGGILVWTKDRTVFLKVNGADSFDEEEIVFSPDSTRAVVLPFRPTDVSGGIHHWIVRRDGSAPVDIAPPCERCNSFSYAWSPDGRWLAAQYEQFDALGHGGDVTGNTTGLGEAILDPSSGAWTVIPEQTGESLLGWRNDHVFLGQQFTSDGHGRIIAYDATDGSRTVLPYDASPAFSFLPSGKSFVTLSVSGSGNSQRDSIGLQDVATGRTTSVWTGPKGMEIADSVLAPDGSALAVIGGSSGDQPTDTWVVPLDGSAVTKFPGAIVGETGWQPVLR